MLKIIQIMIVVRNKAGLFFVKAMPRIGHDHFQYHLIF